MKACVLSVLFRGIFSVGILIKEEETCAKTDNEKQGLVNIIFGGVGFIFLLIPITFLTASD